MSRKDEENLEMIQKSIEEAARKVVRNTKNDRREKAAARCAKSDQKKSAQETSQECQSGAPGSMQFDARKDKIKKKAVVGAPRRRRVHRRQR